MESLLGFNDETVAVVGDDQEKSTCTHYTLVPWLNWNEWETVRDSIFSDSPDKISFALNRISTWRSRGCLPDLIDITAAFIEVRQKDPLYRKDLSNAIHSEQMLSMLYCMTIVRLINCAVEKTRKKAYASIDQAADAIGISRTLVDIRNEGCHRDLPALALVRDSAVKAIDWLKSHYWEPQTKLIPFQRDGTANIRREIKSRLHELASCLKLKQSSHPSFSSVKGKRFKKNITKTLKNLVRLYSSFSSEVESVLLELLLKALDSSSLEELPKECPVGEDMGSLLDDWKLVITKFSKKEPELLLMLLEEVLNMIDTQEAMKYETGTHFTSWLHGRETGQIEQLSSLFAWLVGHLKGLKTLCCAESAVEMEVSVGMNLSNAILMEVLRKCLLLSSYGNKQLMDSALHLARLIGNSSLMDKIKKLSFLCLSDQDITQENSSPSSLNNLLIQQDESIHQATKKLELVKRRLTKSKVDRADGDLGSSGRWVMVKLWNPCPVGMLPRRLGSSGRLPVLECEDTSEKSLHSSESKRIWELRQCSTRKPTGDIHPFDVNTPSAGKPTGKRGASCDIYLLDTSSVKKRRETVEGFESDGEDVLLSSEDKGCLLINGAWKKVGEEDLQAIMSALRIFDVKAPL